MGKKELKEKIEKLEKRVEELEKDAAKLKVIELTNLYGNLVRLQSQASWYWSQPMMGSQKRI